MHVVLLDCIALLLAHEKGDVVATGLRYESNQYTVVWSKNRPYSPDDREKAYLENLAASFRGLDHPEITLRVVVDMCKSKVVSRLNKLAKMFKDAPTTNYFRITPDSQAAEDLRRYLVDDAKFMEDVLLVQALNSFMVRIIALTISSPTSEIVDIIMFAYWLSAHVSVTLERLSISTKESYSRVKKVGAYYSACVFIHSILKNLNRKSPALRQSIVLLQLQPPPTTIVTPFADTMVAMNSWPRQQDLPIDDWAMVEGCYSHAQRGIRGSATLNVTAHQHCELTVALHLRQRKVERGFPGPFIEVGCNKASCFYCATYIRTFNAWCTETRQGHRIVVRREHDKCIDGWVMPSSGFQEVTRRVLNTIGSTMQSIVYAVSALSCRLSDPDAMPLLHASTLPDTIESAMEEAAAEHWIYE
ncbi:MAG: hypothetical protein Q9207_003114 [Kuettlingeria erythrocarpa]